MPGRDMQPVSVTAGSMEGVSLAISRSLDASPGSQLRMMQL